MLYYTLNMLQDMYRHEQPQWSEEKIRQKAQEIHKVLNTLDIYWRRSNKRYYQKNVHLYSIHLIEII